MSYRRFLYPGSFDPVTGGHLDIIKRAACLCDELVVAILVNESKKGSLFTTQQRLELLKASVSGIENVRVTEASGLLAELVLKENACAIVRGIRNTLDLEYEKPMAEINRRLTGGVDTLFIAAQPAWASVSSSMIRELLHYGADTEEYMPEGSIPLYRKYIKQFGE